jgi:hypothetical protein
VCNAFVVGYRHVLSLVLGAWLALPPIHAHAMAAPSPRQRSELSLIDGDAALERGDFDDAISKYRAAYYSLAPSEQASYLGAMPVRNAMRAYEQRVVQEQDPEKRRRVRQRQREFLSEFLDAVNGREGAAKEVGQDVFAELEANLKAIDSELGQEQTEQETTDPTEPPVPDPPGGGTTVPPDSRAVDPPDNGTADPDSLKGASGGDDSNPGTPGPGASKASRDWLGLGLVIGGGTLLGTGFGVSAGWWTIRNLAPAKADEGGELFAEGTAARAEYLAGENIRARHYLIAGTVVAGVGLATTIAGAVHIARHRRRANQATAMHFVPLFGPSVAGLAFHRRF